MKEAFFEEESSLSAHPQVFHLSGSRDVLALHTCELILRGSTCGGEKQRLWSQGTNFSNSTQRPCNLRQGIFSEPLFPHLQNGTIIIPNY